MKTLGEAVGMALRLSDGRVLLTVPEAAKVWRTVGSISMSEQTYRRRCQSGDIQRLGIEVTEGPRYMTDLDSLLGYFDRELTAMRVRLDEALRQRKQGRLPEP